MQISLRLISLSRHTNGLALVRMASTSSTNSSKSNLVLTSSKNGVTTLTMNDPKKLNAWTFDMMTTLFGKFKEAAADPSVKVVVLTGTDPYYCAGVNLNSLIKPMHPKKLHSLLIDNNSKCFNSFIEFPKPMIVAANGPAIGACVTSASLCDAIVASEKATFSTPFAALGITPEGCSSVHFERIMGKDNANRMLFQEGWKPTAQEAFKIGLVHEVVPHDQLLARAQALGEEFIKTGRKRWLVEQGKVDEYKAVNAKESLDLANAFLSPAFLDGQYKFLKSKGKTTPATIFWTLKTTRPLWKNMM